MPAFTDVPVDAGRDFARCAYLCGAVLLGQAVWLGVPGFSAFALALIAMAIIIVAAGLVWGAPPARLERAARGAVKPLVALGIAGGLARLPFSMLNPGYPAGDGTFFLLIIVAVALAAGALVLRRRTRARACFAAMVIVHVIAGAGYLTLGDRSKITDVHLVQHLACETLLRGENPFAMTFPDLYGPASPIYPRGIVADGRVQCGYFYPPLPLLMALPGFVLGDVRYAHLGAIALSAALIAFATPRSKREAGGRDVMPAFGPAVMLLLTPTVFYQMRGGWIEPFLLLPACTAVFLAARGRLVMAAAMLGLFAVGKQYAPFALLAAPMLLSRALPPRRAWMLLAVAATAGAAVTLPLALWDVHAFVHSQTALYVGMLRQDSMSFAPLIARATGWRPTLLWPLVAAMTAAAVTLWLAPRQRRGPAGFASAAALVLLCAFALSTQAFGNYYFLASGLLLCAAAAPSRPLPDESAAQTRSGTTNGAR